MSHGNAREDAVEAAWFSLLDASGGTLGPEDEESRNSS